MKHPRIAAIVAIGGVVATGVTLALGCSGDSTPVSAVLAADIPVAHTPDGGWRGDMPPPVLSTCTEPLAEGAPDLRGTWRAVSVSRANEPLTDHPLSDHVERIEQCGDRVVITSEPIIHDMRADGTLENGVNDVAAANFTPIQVAAVFKDNRLDLHPFGYDPEKPPLVTREVIDGQLVWNYVGVTVVMERVDGTNEAES